MVYPLVALLIASQMAAQPPSGRARDCKPTDPSYFSGTEFADRESWYGKHLAAMKEPRLCAAPGVEVYRFLWLRSFHNPIVVRIQRDGDHYTLHGKQLSGAGGYEPGELLRDTTIRVTNQQITSIRALVDNTRFWSMGEERSLGHDGAQWVLEVVSTGRYHVVDRWSPGDDGKSSSFQRLCLEILALSGLTPNPSEIY